MAPLLVCPGCRTRTPDGERLDVRTLDRTGDLLACACGRRYPVIDGVPILLADPRGLFEREIAGIVERDLAPEVAGVLAADGPEDAPYARLLEHLSIYLDAHWGDRATPPPDGPGPAFASAELVARLADLPRVPTAVELGCSAGRVVAELARSAEHVVGIELQFAALRRARHLLDGDPVRYARRAIGRHYASAVAAAGDRAVPAVRRTLLCADALDPPLLPGSAERVVALNLLDSVPNPLQLLLVVDGLCVPGGEVILATPFAWQAGVTPDHHRLGGADPASDLAALLTSGRDLGSRYEILEEAEVAWTLRKDERSAVAYRTYYLRAKKLGGGN